MTLSIDRIQSCFHEEMNEFHQIFIALNIKRIYLFPLKSLKNIFF